MRIWTIFALCSVGCSLDLDFTSEGTAVTATARGDGTTEVSVCGGPRDLFTCEDGTAFTATMGAAVAAHQDFHLQLLGGQVAHLAEDRPELEIVVTRDSDGAQMSVALPPPFTITAPAEGATISRAAGLQVAWSVSAGDILWETVGDCGASNGRASGTATTLRGLSLPEVTAPCDLDVIISHRRDGHVGRGWADGSHIQGVQQRTVHVRLVP